MAYSRPTFQTQAILVQSSASWLLLYSVFQRGGEKWNLMKISQQMGKEKKNQSQETWETSLIICHFHPCFLYCHPGKPSDRFWNVPGSSLLQSHRSCYFYLEQFSQSVHGSFSSFKYWVIGLLLRKNFSDDPDRIVPLNSTPSYHHFYSFC